MKIFNNLFEQIISLENLFAAWQEFRKDKHQKSDVQKFEFSLEKNIFELHQELRNKRYYHGAYTEFYIQDPKVRRINKATVRDRVLHHAIFKILNPIFEPTFIANSFSCRIGKGTHRGVRQISTMARIVSNNFTNPCYGLKCDIKKFFASMNHKFLLKILNRKIADSDTMWLLENVIESFSAGYVNLFEKRGVPIGNLTSQLFANVYMNEFDQFVKHKLKVRHYVRYTDDFIILADDHQCLKNLLIPISSFLKQHLSLELHPGKISIRKIHQGIDFLGYVVFPHYKLLRNKTKRRIIRKLNERVLQYRQGVISESTLEQSLQSYLGVLSHANAYRFKQELINNYWYRLNE